MSSGTKVVFGVLLVLPFIGTCGGCFMKNLAFNRAVEGRLKRAGDANTVDMAAKELKAAIEYAKANGMTTGNTSIVWDVPSNDVGFWYENLVASHAELVAVSAESSPLEQTNVLLKLRESLMDHGEKGDSVTCPERLFLHPNIVAWWMATAFTLLLAVVGGFLATLGLEGV